MWPAAGPPACQYSGCWNTTPSCGMSISVWTTTRRAIPASLRLAEQIAEQFEIASTRLISENKDWNDDLTELAERDHAVQMVQQMG